MKQLNDIIMKRLMFIFPAIVLALFACSSCDYDELEIKEDNILGLWVEEYSDYSTHASKTQTIWLFRDNNWVDIHMCDVFVRDSVFSKTYHVGLLGDNVISLNVLMSDYSGADYKITKLTKEKMEWQEIGVGRDFLPGTLGSEFIRFKKITE